MMAEIGIIASVVGVIGFSGQVIHGCQYLKGLIDHIKDAPDEVQTLGKQLELIETTITRLEEIVEEANGIQVGLTDVSKVVQFCREAVNALVVHVGPAMKVFNELEGVEKSRGVNDNTYSKRTARGWNRLKFAFNESRTKALMTKLEQAKSELLSTHANIIQTLQLEQHNLSKNHEVSIRQLLDQTAVSSTVLDRTFTTTHETLDAVHKAESSMSMIFQESKCTTGEIMAICHSTLGGVNALNMHFPETAIQTTAAVNDLRAELHTILGSESVTRVIDEAVRNALSKHFNPQVNAQMSCQSPSNSKSDIIHQDKSVGQNRPLVPKRRVNSIKRTRYRMFIGTIYIETISSETVDELNFESRGRKIDFGKPVSITKVDIRFNPKFFEWGFQVILSSVNQAYNTEFDMQLRSYRVVPHHSPIFDAARTGDIAAIKKLFDGGMASPFDMDEFGYSILETAFGYLAGESNCLQTVQFLLDCGSNQKTSLFSVTPFIIRNLFEDDVTGPQLLRILIENCECRPCGGSELACCITTEMTNRPTVLVLLQQDQWDIDLQHGETPTQYFENQRLMLSDISGQRMREAICCGKSYVLFTEENWVHQYLLHRLISLAALYTSSDLATAVAYRIGHLIKAGLDPRQWGVLSFRPSRGSLRIFDSVSGSPSKIARNTGNTQVWERGLRIAGWTTSEIYDLMEQELYLGIPELFAGVNYFSRIENCGDFFHCLSTGYFSSMDEPQIWQISREIYPFICVQGDWQEPLGHWEIRKVIKTANRTFRERKTPGGWKEDKEGPLVPGVDFEIPYWWNEWWKSWHNDAECDTMEDLDSEED